MELTYNQQNNPKNILYLIIFFIILTAMLLMGCYTPSIRNGAVVTDIETYSDFYKYREKLVKGCIYRLKPIKNKVRKNSFELCDSCGKFQIGDTIYLTK